VAVDAYDPYVFRVEAGVGGNCLENREGVNEGMRFRNVRDRDSSLDCCLICQRDVSLSESGSVERIVLT
jgi:hypothetical protein